MWRIPCIVAAGLAVAGPATAPPVAAQTNFEGVVTVTLHHPGADGKSSVMTQTIKGHKMKIEGMGPKGMIGGSMIVDGDAKTMMMLMPEQRKYMLLTKEMTDEIARIAEPKNPRAGGGEPKTKVDFANTGRTETVAGVKCEVWHGRTERAGARQEWEVCIANGAGFDMFGMMSGPFMRGQSAEIARYRTVVGPGKGIMKAVRIANGKRTVQMEVTKIERKKVSGNTFKPPAGYTAFNPADMMRPRRGGPGAPNKPSR